MVPVLFQLPGLEPNVTPFSTNSSSVSKMNKCMSFTYKDQLQGKRYKITRKQLWFLPTFSITVDSSQGRSLNSAVVHLGGEYSSLEKPYVMFSRVIHGDNLFVLGDWSKDLVKLTPNKDMIQHVNDLMKKEKITVDQIAHVKSTINSDQDLLLSSSRRKTRHRSRNSTVSNKRSRTT